MEKLKSIISLAQASKLSGYNQDYLGSLVRKGEIKAQKVGRSWFTTEEEIKNFLLKQKVRHDDLAVGDFLSRRRTKNIFTIAIVVFVGIFSIGVYLFNKKDVVAPKDVNQVLSTETEVLVNKELSK